VKSDYLYRRRVFDLRVLTAMRCATFDFEAYRSIADLERRQSRVTDPAAGATVTKYRWIFRIPTHISRDHFAPETELFVNTDVPDYPREPPDIWILSNHVPWSPHFRRNAPVCIAPELWVPTGGHITLGDLAIHIAHLLNWHEEGRGRDYVGWNPAAIEHHWKRYHGRPINPDLRYPSLPRWLAGERPAKSSFQNMNPAARPDPGFRILR